MSRIKKLFQQIELSWHLHSKDKIVEPDFKKTFYVSKGLVLLMWTGGF